MCGRFTIAVNKEDLKEHLYRQFGIEDFEVDIFLPRYNVAPGEKIIAVISDGKNFRAGLMRWGFVPSFSSGFEIINARRETLSEKPSFKNSFRNKRCLILADGYYEWKKRETETSLQDRSKRPKTLFLRRHLELGRAVRRKSPDLRDHHLRSGVGTGKNPRSRAHRFGTGSRKAMAYTAKS